MNTWKPISKIEIVELLKEQLNDCSLEQQVFFEKYSVLPYKVPIHRLGKVEDVFVVAAFPSGILYYEDVEEGFEFVILEEDGAIHNQGCNQFELKHVLSQLVSSNPAFKRDALKRAP